MSWPLTGLVSRKMIGSPVRRLVLLTMASRANDDGSGVYFSYETIARACELSRATVKRVIKDFEREKLIVKVGTRACENGETNDFTLCQGFIEALPDLAKDPVQPDPGSLRPGSGGDPGNADPGQREPGSQKVAKIQSLADRGQAEPGSERPPSNTTLLKDTSTPLRARTAAFDAPLWRGRVEQAIELAGEALAQTNPVHRMPTVFRLLCEPLAGEPCDWELDVLPAIAAASARKARFDKWDYIKPAAIENRDRRLAGLPAPQAQPARVNGSGHARRPDTGAVLNRIAAEMGVK